MTSFLESGGSLLNCHDWFPIDFPFTGAQNLKTAFNRQIRSILDTADPHHLSIFALAPMPLMIMFGSLITDKVPAQVYQLHREPFQTWHWLDGPSGFTFHV